MRRQPTARLPSSFSSEIDEIAKLIERSEKVNVTATLSTRLIAIHNPLGEIIGKLRVMSLAAFTILQVDAVGPVDSRKLASGLKMLERVHGWQVRSQKGKVELLRVLENPTTLGSRASQSLLALKALGLGSFSLEGAR
jgi:hypothetical protein